MADWPSLRHAASSTNGDGWVSCTCGGRHWGRFGAAGLLLHHHDTVLLQMRAYWSHEGGTWGVPGGARNRDETPLQAALREAWEEAGVPADAVRVSGEWVDDHGSWRYTTVVAEALRVVEAWPRDHESVELRWFGVDEVAGLPTHPAFAHAWPHLRRLLGR